MVRSFFKGMGLLLVAILAVMPLISTASAQTPEEFYKGKTLRMMHVTGAGGSMDLYVLLAIKHMQKHLPPGTNAVLEHRPGAGGIVGANYLYAAAPKDGTYMGMPTPSVVLLTFGNPDQARYKPDEFISLGRFIDVTRIFVARGDSGLKTFMDATKKETIHGTMPPGSSPHIAAMAANEVIGTKFKVVPGYSGGGPLYVAMEQGEIQSTTVEAALLLSSKWDQVQDGRTVVLGQAGLEPTLGFEKTPLWTDFVPKDHPKKAIIEAVSEGAAIGMGMFFPPGVPADRVAYMRGVLEKTAKDPAYIAEAKERKIPVDWRGPDYIENTIKKSMKQPDFVRQWFFDNVQKK